MSDKPVMRASSKAAVVQAVRRNKLVIVGFCFGLILSTLSAIIFNGAPEQDHANNEFEKGDLIARLWHDWYMDVLEGDYEPIIQPSTSNYSNSVGIEPKFPQNNALIRDKKLKFFRPRFHYNELKIKSRLLLVVLITKEYVLARFGDRLTLKEYHKLVNDLMMESKSSLDHYEDDILYFYPQYLSNNTVTNSILVQNDNSFVETIHVSPERSRMKHYYILQYLFSNGFFQRYSFVFLFKESTWISSGNLEAFLHNLTVTDYVVSVSDGTFPNNDFDYLQDNLFKNDDLLNNGLLLSSNIATSCLLNEDCYLNTFNSQSQQNATFINNRIFWHDALTIRSTEKFEDILLNSRILSTSISVYPIKFGSKLWATLNLITFWNDILHNQRNIHDIQGKLEQNTHVPPNLLNLPLGVHEASRPRNRYEVIPWQSWNGSHCFMPTEFSTIRPLNPNELFELAQIQQLSRPSTDKQIYRRFDPLRGFEYIIDGQQWRIHIVKALNSLRIVENIQLSAVNTELVIVIPIHGKLQIQTGIEFLNRYINSVVMKDSNHKTSLIFVLIFSDKTANRNEADEFESIKKTALYVQDKFGIKIGFVDIARPDVAGTDADQRFPIPLVYLDLITRSLSSTSGSKLILHGQSRMLFSIEMLNRVRLNTLAGRQILSLIPFQEYRLRSSLNNTEFSSILKQSSNLSATIDRLVQEGQRSTFDVRKDNGFFDSNNYDLLSFYANDYLQIRKQISIPFVKSALTISRYFHHLFDPKFGLKYFCENLPKSIKVMRTVEPELRLESITEFPNDAVHIASSKQKLAAIVEEYRERNQL